VAGGRLSSYRFRRRLLWVSVWLAFVVSAVVVSVFFWNTADFKETFSDEPAQLFVAPKKIALTGRDKAAIADVARVFVETAVARESPERAYELVGPMLKGGLSREQWKSGNIPVVYYPVDEARWNVEYATDVEVGLTVLLFPKPGADLRPTVFNMALAPQQGQRGWLITAWSPKGGAPNTGSAGDQTPEAALGEFADRYSARASTLWLLVPAAVLFGAILLPIFLLGRERLVVRRSRRRMDASRFR
jgi:hypothetical protein